MNRPANSVKERRDRIWSLSLISTRCVGDIQRMVPWLDKYIRHSFRDLMKRWEKKEGSAPETYVDIDGVGECVDTFRGMGATTNDPGA